MYLSRITFIRRRQSKKRRVKNKFTYILKRIFILLLLFSLMIFVFLEIQVKPMVAIITEIEAQTMATQAINTAVENLSKDSNALEYFDLVEVERSQENKISGITTDTYNLNKLKSEYTIEAQKQINAMQNSVVGINVGELSGVELLNGVGPQVYLFLSFISSIETQVKSSFVSAGVNQTQHIIELIIEAEIYLTSDDYIPNAIVTTNVPIAQTIIVGDVPALYNGNLLT